MSGLEFHSCGLSEDHDDDDQEIRVKKFLFRLLSALHSCGNLSFRTEKYIKQTGRSYGVNVAATLLPSRAIVSFQKKRSNHPFSSETYTFSIDGGWLWRKHALLDQLCHDITHHNLDFASASQRLKEIEDAPPLYAWYVTLLAYCAVSFCAATLFYGGDWRDGTWAMIYAVFVYYMEEVWSARFSGLSEIKCFLSSFIIAAVATAVDTYVYNGNTCLFAITFGAVVYQLPGITIAIALLEIYAKVITFGSSRCIYGISLASQMGFGLALGYMLVQQTSSLPASYETGCINSVSTWWALLLLPVAMVGFGVVIQAAYRQFLGMILTAGIGYATHIGFYMLGGGVAATPLVAAIMVTIFARIYAYYEHHGRPMVYILAGLLVLVPGGLGVRAMSDMWSGNNQTGLSFTFQMLMIAVSLAVGVFLAVIPSKKWLMPVKVHMKDPDGDHKHMHIEVQVFNPIIRRANSIDEMA